MNTLEPLPAPQIKKVVKLRLVSAEQRSHQDRSRGNYLALQFQVVETEYGLWDNFSLAPQVRWRLVNITEALRDRRKKPPIEFTMDEFINTLLYAEIFYDTSGPYHGWRIKQYHHRNFRKGGRK